MEDLLTQNKNNQELYLWIGPSDIFASISLRSGVSCTDPKYRPMPLTDGKCLLLNSSEINKLRWNKVFEFVMLKKARAEYEVEVRFKWRRLVWYFAYLFGRKHFQYHNQYLIFLFLIWNAIMSTECTVLGPSAVKKRLHLNKYVRKNRPKSSTTGIALSNGLSAAIS